MTLLLPVLFNDIAVESWPMTLLLLPITLLLLVPLRSGVRNKVRG
jgi:hypothetical protein